MRHREGRYYQVPNKSTDTKLPDNSKRFDGIAPLPIANKDDALIKGYTSLVKPTRPSCCTLDGKQKEHTRYTDSANHFRPLGAHKAASPYLEGKGRPGTSTGHGYHRR